MKFEQKITRSIKIKEPSLISEIYEKKITRIKCDVIKVGNSIMYSVRKAYDEEKSSIELDSFKKTLYQFRTPKRILKYNGSTLVISKNVLSEDHDELFRMEIPEVSISLSSPYMTNSVISLPHEYINSMLDERASMLRFSFNETTTNMMQAGVIKVYMVEQVTSMSYPAYPLGRSLRSKSLLGVLSVLDEFNMKLNEFEYVETSPKDAFHKYGVMTFKRRSVDG